MNNLTRRILHTLLLTNLAVLTGCATYTDVREHKDIGQITPNIRSVAILPPDVSIQKINFTGENEVMTDQQDAISKELTKALTKKLSAAKLEVKSFDFAAAAANDPDFAYSVTQCKKAFGETQKTLYAKPVESKNKATFHESIGGSGNHIAESAGVDAFVVLNYNGFKKSGGMMAKDIAAGVLVGLLTGYAPVQAAEGSEITLGIIAANSGEVLWTSRKVHPQLNAQGLELALKEMPQMPWGTAALPAPTTTSIVTDTPAVTAQLTPPVTDVSDIDTKSTPVN